MIEKFIEFLEEHISLNQTELGALTDAVNTVTYSKGKLLLGEGEVSKAFYFVLNGTVRLYYIVDGIEKSAYFYKEGQFVSAYESFTKQVPSKFYLEAIEQTEVVVISQESAYKLLQISPKFESLARIMMEDELIVCQEIIASFVTQNAESRYHAFVAKHKDLLQRIPQHQLATYIGVTPETLSRIRKRSSHSSS